MTYFFTLEDGESVPICNGALQDSDFNSDIMSVTTPLVSQLTGTGKDLFQTQNSQSGLSPTQSKSKQKRDYSIWEKKEAADYARQHGVRPASRHFSIPRKNIDRWMKDESTIVKKPRGRKISYPVELDQKLRQWVDEKQGQKIPVSLSMLKQQALRLIAPVCPQFKASDGWATRFKQRHNLDFRTNKGKASMSLQPSNDIEDRITDDGISPQSLVSQTMFTETFPGQPFQSRTRHNHTELMESSQAQTTCNQSTQTEPMESSQTQTTCSQSSQTDPVEFSQTPQLEDAVFSHAQFNSSQVQSHLSIKNQCPQTQSIQTQPILTPQGEVDPTESISPSPPSRSISRPRRMYSVKQKEKVVEYAKQHGVRPASRDFNIARNNITRWMKYYVKTGEVKSGNGEINRKGQGRKISYPIELEEKLLQWIKERQASELPASISALQEYAIALICPVCPDFKASHGWAARFKTRHKLVFCGHKS